MNLPNAITLFRLVLTGIFAVAASTESTTGYVIALVCFILAAISDWADGYLARKMNLVTALGKLLDPLADKVLVSSGFVFLSAVGLAPVWVTALIIAREFLVTGIRQIAVEQGVVIAADRWGKWKTTFQITFCITGLVHLSFLGCENPNGIVKFLQTLSDPGGLFVFQISLWASAILTAFSGMNYFWKSRSLFSSMSR